MPELINLAPSTGWCLALQRAMSTLIASRQHFKQARHCCVRSSTARAQPLAWPLVPTCRGSHLSQVRRALVRFVFGLNNQEVLAILANNPRWRLPAACPCFPRVRVLVLCLTCIFIFERFEREDLLHREPKLADELLHASQRGGRLTFSCCCNFCVKRSLGRKQLFQIHFVPCQLVSTWMCSWMDYRTYEGLTSSPRSKNHCLLTMSAAHLQVR
ncbi:hypothetical protein HMPREF9701_06067 [Delftia acidovorans CCUG 274B]|nr:hypothetical protein HMPREF9701_06067 [Delftia acidovorans CCUG 274B]